ncbi:MAG TPA: DUF835 domain-containing protein [Thermoplasmata archaeon]|nr:DUF835 domain-containing protein [Thermoplasmata archaeon]
MRLPWPLLLAAEEDDLLKSLLFGRKRDLEEGRSYLVKEPKPKRALEHFRRAIDRGFRPLLVTRQHPNHIERQHGGRDIRVVWLSTTLGKDYMDPHNLNSLSNLVSNFVADAGRAVVLLDGVEYLMMNNDFPRILNFIEFLNEKVAIHRAILLLSLDARAFDPKDLANLERNMTVLE